MTALRRMIRPIVGVATACTGLLAAGVAAHQTVRDAGIQATGTAVITGQVTADNDAKPVRRAIVILTGPDTRNSRATVTDDNGQFIFAALPPGRFSLSGTKPGWVTTYYGSRQPGRGPGTAVALADGQTMTGIAIRLLRGAAVTGRILNEYGQPQPGVRTSVLQYRTVGGQRTLSTAYTGGAPFAQTDDRGEYRLYGLPPGSYVVAVSPTGGQTGFRTVTAEELQWARQRGDAPAAPAARPGQTASYAPVYYPGTFDALQATTITLAEGEERSGVDVVARPMPVARVAGVVRRPDGQRLITPQVTLRRVQEGLTVSTLDPLTSPRASLDPTGAFVFPAVRPGRYVLMIRSASHPPAPAARPAAGAAAVPIIRQLDLWASTEITVQGDDIEGLSLTLEPGVNVSGQLVFENSTLEVPEDLSRARIQLRPPDAQAPGSASSVNLFMGLVTPDASFSIGGVTPGSYVLTAYLPGGSTSGPAWVVKAVTVNKQNVFDRAFDVRAGAPLSDVVVTLTDRVTELSGMLQDQLGRPAPDHQVFVIPTDKAAWTMMSARMRPPTRPASDGRYRVTGLPPGEYFVAALGDIGETDYLDAGFLEQVAAAALKITIAEGEKKQLDLRLQGSDSQR